MPPKTVSGCPGVTNVLPPPVPSTSFSAKMPPVSKFVSNKFLPSKNIEVLKPAALALLIGTEYSADAFNKKYPGTFCPSLLSSSPL